MNRLYKLKRKKEEIETDIEWFNHHLSRGKNVRLSNTKTKLEDILKQIEKEIDLIKTFKII